MEKIKVSEPLRAMVQQVHHYEEAQIKVAAYTTEKNGYLPARAFVTKNVKDFPAAWTLLLRLGLNPLEIEHELLVNPLSSERKNDHPVVLAAVFQNEDRELASGFITRSNQISDELKAGAKPLNGPTDRFAVWDHHRSNQLLILPPPAPWMPLLTHSRGFELPYAAWFTKTALATAMETSAYRGSSGSSIYSIRAALQRGGEQDPAVLQAAAMTALKRALKQPQAYAGQQYGELAALVFCSDQEEAATFLKTQKGKVQAALGAALRDPPEAVMIEAIRAMCRGVTAYKTMAHLQRSPTLQELRKANVRGLLDVLYHMPWVHMAPLVKQSPGEIRALMLKEATNSLERAKLVLVDHEHRVKLREKEVEQQVQDSDWAPFQERLVKQYQTAQPLRTQLQRLDPEVATVLLMDHLDPKEHLAPIRELLNDAMLRGALAEWPAALQRGEYRLQET